MSIEHEQDRLKNKALAHRRIVEASREVKANLSTDVESFLANGGKIETMRECSVGEAKYRSVKPYKVTKKDGSTFIKRYDMPIGTQKIPDALRGHSSK
jgi:hypothetical protein